MSPNCHGFRRSAGSPAGRLETFTKGAAPLAGLGPTAPEERIDSLDILRGFALFGILWANLPGGGGPAPLDRNVVRIGGEEIVL